MTINEKTYGPRISKCIDAIFDKCPDITCEELFKLAVACLDQAGVPVSYQAKVIVLCKDQVDD